jgi:hypothetical protein
MSKRASQNPGIAKATKIKKVIDLSTIEFCLTAEIVPSTIETEKIKKIPIKLIKRVIGSDS